VSSPRTDAIERAADLARQLCRLVGLRFGASCDAKIGLVLVPCSVVAALAALALFAPGKL